MKTWIVYYSLEGNSEYTAQQIAKEMHAELLPLHPVKAYPTGKVSKLIWGGKSAVMSEAPALEPYQFDKADCARIIFGFPVWASKIAPPLRTFIRNNDLKGIRFAAFACQTAGGSDKAFIQLKSELGIDALDAELVLNDPKTNPDDANLQKIKDFCKKLCF